MKYVNTIINSFFRTFGRFLFYLLVGVLTYFCINGFPKVHALSTSNNIATSFNNQGGINSFEQKVRFTASSGAFNGSLFLFNGPSSGVVNYQINLPSGFDKGDLYNITGILYYTTKNVENSACTLPILSINDSPCFLYNADPTVYNAGVGEIRGGNNGFYTFQCLAVRVPFNDSGINGINIVNNSGGIGTQIGIWEVFNFEKYSTATSQDIVAQQQETNKKLDELNDSITDSDTSEANDQASGFFNDFESSDYGLSDIITLPLNMIKSITSAKCSPLTIPLPFVDTDLTLPCMYSVYQTYFGDILTIYQTITTGLIAYYICINILALVRSFKDPEKDNVEVMEL